MPAAVFSKKKFFLFFLLTGISCLYIVKSLSVPFAESRHPVIIIFLDGLNREYIQERLSAKECSSPFCRLAAEGLIFENNLSVSALPHTSFNYFFVLGKPKSLDIENERRGKFSLSSKDNLISFFSPYGYTSALFTRVSPLVRSGRLYDLFDQVVVKKHMAERFIALHRWVLYNHHKPFFVVFQSRILQNVKKYQPHKASESELKSLYYQDAAIIEGYLERFFGLLDILGQWDESFVIVTSERALRKGFDDSSRGNSEKKSSLYDRRTPLIVKFPKSFSLPGGKINQSTLSSDILPTILDFLDISSAQGIKQRSLRVLLEGGS